MDDARTGVPRRRDGQVDKQMLHARGMSDNNLFGGDDVNPHPLGGSRLVRAHGFCASGVVPAAATTAGAERRYWVAVFWGGELGDRVSIRGWDAGWITELLETHLGESVPVTVTGPWVPLRLDSPLAVHAGLSAFTRVHEMDHDDPPGLPKGPPFPVVF